jgi:short-subunit dehydrogenase
MRSPRYLGQTALVTGASSGIGRAIALALAREGAQVALVARRQSALEAVAADIARQGGKALVIPADVSQPESAAQAVALAVLGLGAVDLLVASAGQYVRSPIPQLTTEELERSMAVNFYGAWHVIQAVLPTMLARRRGHILVLSSLDAKTPLPLDAPYVAAKCALTGLADVMRQELRGTGVHVSTILPGRVDTPLISHLQFSAVSAKVSPEMVARAALRALHRGGGEIVVPASLRGFCLLKTVAPGLADWFARRLRLEGWPTTDPS